MAGRFDFQSDTGNMGDALADFLVKRQLQQRQMMLDEISRKNIESQMADRVTNRKIQEENVLVSKAAREAAAADAIEKTKLAGFDRTMKKAEMTPRGVTMTPEFSQELQDAGLGHLEAPGEKTYGTMDPEQGQGPTMTQEPGTFAGTTKQEQFDAGTELKRDLAEAQNDIQRMVAEGRIDSARASQLMAQANLELRKQALDLQREKADDKKAEADRKQKALRSTAIGHGDEMRRVLGDLMEFDPSKKDATGNATGGFKLKKGTASLVGGSRYTGGLWGKLVPGSPEADAQAALQALTGKNVLELMRELKSQSSQGATGFGALSEKELALLQAAASRLQTSQSEGQFLEELVNIDRLVNKIYEENPGVAAAVPPLSPGTAPAATPAAGTGGRKRRWNPQTGKLE